MPRPLVMGVLNVTPDSFSDGGQWFDRKAAIARGRALFDEGADVVDVGGESTRPGARPVDLEEELERVVPVVTALAGGGTVSVDTRKAEVAREAVAAGANMINDVSASLAHVAADTGAAFVAMHMQGTPETMQDDPTYEDVVVEVRDFLVARAEEAQKAGVQEVWIDPGLGFGKTIDHNLQLLRRLPVLVATGYPVMIGASRKGFLRRLTDATIADSLAGSLAAAAVAFDLGAGMVRAHDIAETVQAAVLVGGGAGG